MDNYFEYYISNVIYTLISGFSLIIFSVLLKLCRVPYIHPSFTFSATWGVALFFLSFTPLIGFYYLQSHVVLLYTFGAIFFSISSAAFFKISESLKSPEFNVLKNLDFKKIFKFYCVISILILPSVVLDIMSYGSSIAEIAYNLRSTQINGQQVGSALTSNYFVVAIFASCLLIYGVTVNRISVLPVVLSLLPFIILTLILTGRSLLVSLILSWSFIYFFAGGRVSIKSVVIFAFSMFIVLFFGATLVSKVDVEGLGIGSTLLVLFIHIVDYLLQGPILFWLYFDDLILIRESWDTLDNACHIIAKLGFCEPIVNIHADNAYMGDGKLGNVYSFYFATYPHYGLFGTFFFLILYSVISSAFYLFARRGGVFSLVASAFMFSAIVLSIYKDGFGDSYWMLVKFYFIALFFQFFFKKRLVQKKSF